MVEIVQDAATKPHQTHNDTRWQACYAHVRAGVPRDEFDAWLKGLHIEDVRTASDGTTELLLSVLKPIHRKMIEDRYKGILDAACRKEYESFGRAVIVIRSLGQKCTWTNDPQHRRPRFTVRAQQKKPHQPPKKRAYYFREIESAVSTYFNLPLPSLRGSPAASIVAMAQKHLFLFASELGQCSDIKIAELSACSVEEVSEAIVCARKRRRVDVTFWKRHEALEELIGAKAGSY